MKGFRQCLFKMADMDRDINIPVHPACRTPTEEIVRASSGELLFGAHPFQLKLKALIGDPARVCEQRVLSSQLNANEQTEYAAEYGKRTDPRQGIGI